ncbi:MAG: tetratricopeptide repeat protein [Lachnospiraceae bacterium]|nr:tetratricopeptide repeat protein [Lachnospiraceae bacterium]
MFFSMRQNRFLHIIKLCCGTMPYFGANRSLRSYGGICLAALVLSLLCACGGADRKAQTELRDAGIAAISAGDYDAAYEHFKEAIACGGSRVSEREIDLTYYLAACSFLRGDFDEAIASYDNLIAYDKKNADAYFLRGSVYLQQEKQGKALEDYRKATSIANKDYELAIAIYNNLSKNGLKKEGMQFIDAASRIGGDDSESLFYRGRIYQILGQNGVAKTTFSRAMETGSDEAAVYLARAYKKDGQKKKAKKLAEKYSKNTDNLDSKHSQIAGELLLIVGKYKKANKIYDQALKAELEQEEKSVWYKDLLKGQIAALEYCGEFEQARTLAREYIESYPSDAHMARELSFLEMR